MHIKQVISGLLVYAVCAGALAQPPEGRPMHDRFSRMQQELNLSDEQVQQMRDIRAKGGSREEIDAVLTDEQRARMAELRSQHSQGKQGKRGGIQRMQQELNLSDEQVKQMEEIRARGGSREEVNAVLTEEQRKQWEEIRTKRSAKRQGPPPEAGSTGAPAAQTGADTGG